MYMSGSSLLILLLLCAKAQLHGALKSNGMEVEVNQIDCLSYFT